MIRCNMFRFRLSPRWIKSFDLGYQELQILSASTNLNGRFQRSYALPVRGRHITDEVLHTVLLLLGEERAHAGLAPAFHIYAGEVLKHAL